MPSLNNRQFRQEPLFDAPRQPHGKTPNQFLEGAQWHGTDMGPSWLDKVTEAGVPVHMGTVEAAQDIMMGDEDKGTYFPVRPKKLAGDVLTDEEANTADILFRQDRGTGVEGSRVSESVPTKGELVGPNNYSSDLRSGRSLAYENESEDVGSMSYVSPPGGFSTLRDTDRGLASGSSWKPRDHFTHQDLVQQGLTNPRESRKVSESPPRLFETVQQHNSPYTFDVSGEDVQEHHGNLVRGFKGELAESHLYRLGAPPPRTL